MIRELRSVYDPAFRRLTALYEAEFPRATREPVERLEAELRGDYRVPFRFFLDERDEGLGFVRFAALEATQAMFVLHIAVSAGLRRRGVGEGLVAAVRSERPNWPLLAEVEPGVASAWWERRGARVVSETYTQPALYPDTALVPLRLVAIGRVEDPGKLITTFYDEVWELGGDDPLVTRARAGVTE